MTDESYMCGECNTMFHDLDTLVHRTILHYVKTMPRVYSRKDITDANLRHSIRDQILEAELSTCAKCADYPLTEADLDKSSDKKDSRTKKTESDKKKTNKNVLSLDDDDDVKNADTTTDLKSQSSTTTDGVTDVKLMKSKEPSNADAGATSIIAANTTTSITTPPTSDTTANTTTDTTAASTTNTTTTNTTDVSTTNTSTNNTTAEATTNITDTSVAK